MPSPLPRRTATPGPASLATAKSRFFLLLVKSRGRDGLRRGGEEVVSVGSKGAVAVSEEDVNLTRREKAPATAMSSLPSMLKSPTAIAKPSIL